jgi:AcrR family transcriptional regulator
MATKTAEPRVDPRVARTQKLMRDALSGLLHEKSFTSITVQDIAERAGINRATFYAHFPDKYALLDTTIRERFRTSVSLGEPLGSEACRSTLEVITNNVFGFVAEYRDCTLDKEFEPNFEAAVHFELNALLRPVFGDPVALVMSSAIAGVAMCWRLNGTKEMADDLVRHVVEVLWDGVSGVSKA